MLKEVDAELRVVNKKCTICNMSIPNSDLPAYPNRLAQKDAPAGQQDSQDVYVECGVVGSRVRPEEGVATSRRRERAGAAILPKPGQHGHSQ